MVLVLAGHLPGKEKVLGSKPRLAKFTLKILLSRLALNLLDHSWVK